MKLSAFITYLTLFFSMIFVVIIIYFGLNIFLVSIYKENFLVSRGLATSLASIINYLASSTNNVSLMLNLPRRDIKVFFYRDNVTVEMGNDFFSARIYLPNYIILKSNSEFIESSEDFAGTILMVKTNNEIEVI